jgi:CRP-like cAMP-binding protein
MVEINIFRHSTEAQVLQAGELLFREGDHGDDMFAVVEGEVELTHNGRVVETVGPGGILGELALIDPGPRSATATVGDSARVVRVDARHFTYLVQEHPTFALQVMKIMTERLRRTGRLLDGDEQT